MAPRRSRLFLLLGAGACLALDACGGGFSTQELQRAPVWFKARQKELAGQDYPSLAAVPPLAQPNRDDPHWAAVQAELLAAQKSVAASPRATPAPPATEGEAFDKAARDAVDATRPK